MVLNILKKALCLNLFIILLTSAGNLRAQTNPSAHTAAQVGFNPRYHFLHSGNLVADKNFYLLTVIDKTPQVKALLVQDSVLQNIMHKRAGLINSHATDTCRMPYSLVADFRWSHQDSVRLMDVLAGIYTHHQSAIDQLINQHLRPSGYYQRFSVLSNKDLWLHAWNQYLYGINYIIDQYGLGKKMRYPIIDSASYVVTSRYYKTLLKDMFAYLSEHTLQMQTFYEPSLAVAMHLMDANDRDEPARHEPLELKDNHSAFMHVRQVNFNKYTYSAILIPGNGPELRTTPISPINKIHCDLAAERYLKGMAPFIITSGGYCYPFQGPYCEAIEMKKYLIKKFNIPENAILIDPQARHTTTNIRNANRLIIRYGIPVNKPVLFVTSKSQADYSANPNFDKRNKRELGYLPYQNKKQTSMHDIIYYPTFDCLHMDPYDPLDP